LLSEARQLHRKAQLYWDWVFVENSTGFHNSAEANRVLDAAAQTVEELLNLLADYR
jgi:nitrite reductase (cytochrome c-552)